MKRRGVRGWFRLPVTDRRRSAADVEAELSAHVQARMERLMAAGSSEADARVEAERRLGGLLHAREVLVREAWQRDVRLSLREQGRAWLDDLRYVARAVLRERGYAAVVVVTLALGIGANATMLGVLDRLLLSGPAHVQRPHELQRFYVNLRYGSDEELQTFAPVSGGALSALQAGVPSMEHVSGDMPWNLTLGTGPAARQLDLGAVSASYFPLTGVRPVIGRFFDEAEAAPPAGARVIVLAHHFWRTEFGGRPDVLGEALLLSGERFTVIGVAPRGFTGVELAPRDGWIPLPNAARQVSANWHASWGSLIIPVVGRLRPGATVERAAAEATAAWQAAYEGPMQAQREASITLAGISADRSGQEPMEARVARWLVAVSAIVLLVACANVANLYFARGLRRRREIAVRLALGISRARLARLLLMESLVLAVLGGVAALIVAYWGAELVRGVFLPHVDWTTSALNARVLAVAAALTALVGVLTGLLPAWQATSTRLPPALTASAHAPPSAGRMRSMLAAAQAAFCVVLLVGAGLFVRSVQAVQGMDLGLQADRLIHVRLEWDALRDVPPSEQVPLARQRDARALELAESIAALPGVEFVGAAVGGPFLFNLSLSFRADGADSIPRLPGGGPYLNAVTAAYFDALGTPLLRGRSFHAGEGAGTEPVAIVSRTVADRVWPRGDALDRCLYLGNATTCSRVVGVVADVRRLAIVEEPAMQIYVPFGQQPFGSGAALFVRTAVPHERMVEPVRRALHDMEPSIRYVRVQPFGDLIAPHTRAWRLGAALFAVCGALGLLIAAIGLYSVIAYLVLHRRHEIGVRIALGAQRRDVVAMVLRHALLVAGVGLAAGGTLALLAAPRLQPLLFETQARDPAVLTVTALTLALAALAAGVLPALRASRVPPTDALRDL